MIHYHGCPLSGPLDQVARFYRSRHVMVSHAHPAHLELVAEFAQSFALDNGAFSAWVAGKPMDVDGYTEWVEEWHRHPGFAWALIPDVIDGTERENDRFISQWPSDLAGVPIWHLHEPIERLRRLAGAWPLVALGSSGRYATPGTESWWCRMDEAMESICDIDGRPECKLHGLRMLNVEIFTRLPFASADSTNACQNAGSVQRFGQYTPREAWQRACVIADRIEAFNSAATWRARETTEELLFHEAT